MVYPEHCRYCRGKGCLFCPSEIPAPLPGAVKLLADVTYEEWRHPLLIEAGRGFLDADSMLAMVERHGGKTPAYWQEWEQSIPILREKLQQALAQIRAEKIQ